MDEQTKKEFRPFVPKDGHPPRTRPAESEFNPQHQETKGRVRLSLEEYNSPSMKK